MKLFLAYAHAKGMTDGVSYGQLLRHLPLTTTVAQADAVVILACWVAGFSFNHGLNAYAGKKPIIVIDYLEYGWDWPHDVDNVLGRGNCVPCSDTSNGHWGTLNLFMRGANPRLQFKRELRKQDSSDSVVPIEFLAHLPKSKIQSKDAFDARPLDVFNSWGLTHPSRVRAHAGMRDLMRMGLINLIEAYNGAYPPQRSWLSVETPAPMRRPMTEILGYQSMAKISVSLYGAGRKCFRSAEAPENCIMAQQQDDFAWSYPWDESNSVRLHEPGEVGELLSATQRDDLYELYLASQRNLDNYRLASYLPNWVMANIKRVL